MYRVVIMPSVRRDIRRLPSGYTRLVFGRIRSLAENPRPRGTRRLQGTSEYRLRIGVYRAVYTIDDAARVVTVNRVRHRGEVYGRRFRG